MVRRKIDMVYYCPGDSIGSPAGLPKSEAERYLREDNDMIDLLRSTGGGHRAAPNRPHIGGLCDRCRTFEKG